MQSSIEKVKAELEAIGYQPFELDSPQGRVVAFPYTIKAGSHKGEKVHAGISFQGGEEGYPEYPPHWVHVSPPINDGKGSGVEYTRPEDGNSWLAMSRPPRDVWDLLPTKDMRAYISDHLSRLWSDV